MRPSLRAVLAAAASLCLLGTGLQAASAGPAPSSSSPPAPTVTNPISDEFSDTYADPAIIRGKDGYWYMYATSDPLTEAPSPFGLMHIARSLDFSSWEYLGTVFDDETRPDWATSGSFLWAPDIRYVAGEYVLYYTVTDTVADPGRVELCDRRGHRTHAGRALDGLRCSRRRAAARRRWRLFQHHRPRSVR